MGAIQVPKTVGQLVPDSGSKTAARSALGLVIGTDVLAPGGSGAGLTGIPAGSALTGSVAIVNGGTGQTTANAALNALLPTQAAASGKVLSSDGTNVSWSTPTAYANSLGTYICQTASNAPANAQILGALATGLLKSTTTTGVVSIAVAGTDYVAPTGSGAGLTNLTAANIASGTAGISVTGNAGTATNGVVTTGTYADPAWITSLAGSKISGNITGNAANVTGTVAIASGGTGQITASAAINALLPTQTSNSGKHLSTDGTNVSWATLATYANLLGSYIVQTATNAPSNAQVLASLATGIVKNTTTTGVLSIAAAGTDYLAPTGNGSGLTSLTAANLSGAVAIVNGGTGQTTANAAHNTLLPTQTGNSGKFLTTDATNSSWAAVAASGITGTLAIANGGTGQTTATAATNALLPSQASANGKFLTSDGTNTSWGVASGSGADSLGTYITQTATHAPANAQVLASLATGLLKNTTTTGVLSIAVAGTDYLSGTVAIANGGTGQTTATAATNALLPAQTSNSGKFLTTDGTNTSWGVASGSGADASGRYIVQIATNAPANAQVLASLSTGLVKVTTTTGVLTTATAGTDYLTPTGNGSGLTSLTAANLSGSVAIANGGSGQTTANAALNAFLPTQTSNSGKFLTTDGTNSSWGTGGSGANALGTYITQTATNAPANAQILGSLSTGLMKVTTTTGVISTAAAGTDYVTPTGSGSGLTSLTAANLSGSVAIANGGSGQTTANAALNAFLPTQTSASGKNLQSDGTNTSWVTPTVYANASGSYIVQTATNAPGSAQVLASLSTGLMKVTTTTGVISTAAAGTDYLAPAGNGSALTGITQSQVSGLTSALALLAPLASPTFTGTVTTPLTAGLVKSSSGGVISVASAGTDYLAPTGNGSGLTSLTAANISGQVAIANGGTGQSTAATAINALVPSQTGNNTKFLTTNGTVVSWGTPSGGGGGALNTQTYTSNTTLTTEDLVKADTSGGTFTLEMPDATTFTKVMEIKAWGTTNPVSIACKSGSGQTFDGQTSPISFLPKKAFRFWSDGSNWMIS